MFVARIARVDDEYVLTIPYDVVVQCDLHDGQVVSVVVEPLVDYAEMDTTTDPGGLTRQLNEDAASYRDDE